MISQYGAQKNEPTSEVPGLPPLPEEVKAALRTIGSRKRVGFDAMSKVINLDPYLAAEQPKVNEVGRLMKQWNNFTSFTVGCSLLVAGAIRISLLKKRWYCLTRARRLMRFVAVWIATPWMLGNLLSMFSPSIWELVKIQATIDQKKIDQRVDSYFKFLRSPEAQSEQPTM